MGVQEGKVAPAFSLPDADGKMVDLKDLKGKYWKWVAKAADHPRKVLETLQKAV